MFVFNHTTPIAFHKTIFQDSTKHSSVDVIINEARLVDIPTMTCLTVLSLPRTKVNWRNASPITTEYDARTAWADNDRAAAFKSEIKRQT